MNQQAVSSSGPTGYMVIYGGALAGRRTDRTGRVEQGVQVRGPGSAAAVPHEPALLVVAHVAAHHRAAHPRLVPRPGPGCRVHDHSCKTAVRRRVWIYDLDECHTVVAPAGDAVTAETRACKRTALLAKMTEHKSPMCSPKSDLMQNDIWYKQSRHSVRPLLDRRGYPADSGRASDKRMLSGASDAHPGGPRPKSNPSCGDSATAAPACESKLCCGAAAQGGSFAVDSGRDTFRRLRRLAASIEMRWPSMHGCTRQVSRHLLW